MVGAAVHEGEQEDEVSRDYGDADEELMRLDEELDLRASLASAGNAPIVRGNPPTGPSHHVPCRRATPEELLLLFLPERQPTWRGGGPRRSVPRR